MKHVTVLACPEALASSMMIPLEMINAASVIQSVRGHRPKQLQLQIAGEDSAALTLTGSVTLTPAVALRDILRSDLIFIPALWGNPQAAVRRHPRIVEWLAAQYEAGATLCSVGTGSWFLAETGLLDGRSATTHWRYFDQFQHRYPRVKLQRKRFITHEDRLYCTGSINAVRDVMLHFVEQLFSAEIADEVAHHFTHELKRSHESIVLADEQKNTHHDEEIIKVQEWLQAHYAEEIQLSRLASRFNLNLRTFNRRFRAAAGKTPLQYLQETRVAQARELLKKSNLTLAEIAFAVGYQDVSYFSGLFRRLNAVTPGIYRNLVRKKLFNVEPGSGR
jgi:transcriptional regulator GlxA family with amidase domain